MAISMRSICSAPAKCSSRARLACPHSVAARPASRKSRLQVQARQGGLGDENVDVAVFRFTLGIPGFEDRLIPRVVGAVGGLLIAVNHVLGAQPTPEAQGRAEVLGFVLAVLLVVVPELEERLREALPGRGRMKAAESVEGATNVFFLQQGLQDKLKQELAWSSFSLIKNTNSSGVVLTKGGKALLMRGTVGSAVATAGQADKSLAAAAQALTAAASSSSELRRVAEGSEAQVWLPDRAAIAKAGLASCGVIPQGVESVVLQHVPGAQAKAEPGLLLVFSERPRALSDRERKWAGAVADKLSAFL